MNIRFRTVYQEIYTSGLPKKHSGRNKIIIHSFFQQQFKLLSTYKEKYHVIFMEICNTSYINFNMLNYKF